MYECRYSYPYDKHDNADIVICSLQNRVCKYNGDGDGECSDYEVE